MESSPPSASTYIYSLVKTQYPFPLKVNEVSSSMLLQLAGNCKMRLVSYTPNCHYARIEKLFSSKYYADLFEPTLRVQTLAPDLQNGIVSIMMRMKMEALYGSSGVLGLGGSQLDTIPVLAAIRPLIGLRRDPITATVTYRFADDLVLLPLQLLTPVDVITNPHLIAPSGETLSQRLQPGTDVVFLGNNVLNRLSLFGGVAEVLQVEDGAAEILLKTVPQNVDIGRRTLRAQEAERWYSVEELRRPLGLSVRGILKIAGYYPVYREEDDRKWNIGVGLFDVDRVIPRTFPLSP